MSILPSFALFVILQFWPLVLHLVSAVWYERQRSRYKNHWLLQLEQVADFTPLEQGCAGFHSDHSTLCRFELWVLRHQPDLFFDETLKQIYQLYPEERERPLLTDTFGIFARGARCYTIDLLRDLCHHLLAELEQLDDPVYHQTVLARLDEAALFGQKGDKITPALKPLERAERLQQVVNAALDLHDHLLTLLQEPPFFSPEDEIKLRFILEK